MESKPRTLRITRIREQGRDIRSFDLMPDDAQATHDVQFIPGQVGVLRVVDEEPAYFAFAGAPEDPELEILVKRTIGASAALFDMKEGEQVELIDVAGHGFDRVLLWGAEHWLWCQGRGDASWMRQVEALLKEAANR